VASCGDASFAASGSSKQEDLASRFDVWVDLVRALCVPTSGGAFALGSCELVLGRALSLRRSLLQRASFLSSLDCLRSLPFGAPLRCASGENHHHDQQDKHARPMSRK
jgi:hypothetical protein